MTQLTPLDGKAVSLWVNTAPETSYPVLEEEIETDVAVIGAGIAGLTAAILLKRAGLRVVVLEAGRVGTGVTGHTTGKVSSLQRLVYGELHRSFGERGARTYGEANEAAIEQVATLVESEAIDCDFRRVANYTYAESDGALAQIKHEASLARDLGLPSAYTDSTPLPFPVRGAVRFDAQAQLHAAKYLVGLAGAIAGEGSHVFEESRVTDIDDGASCRVATESGHVTAAAAIVATNFPIFDRGLFFARCHPHRSYLIALTLDGPLPEGTFISADEPLRSIMPHSAGSGLLLIGGEGHRASDKVDTAELYRRLDAWARERFPVASLEYRWSTQDAIPIDGLPYVGRMSPFSRHVYVATGFRKWGLSNGTVAAMILVDQILERPNPWARLFNSNRVKPLAGGRRFITENLRAGARLLVDRIRSRGSDLPDGLEPGEGRVVEVGSEKLAVNRRPSGEVHVVSAVCTHLGCVVEWNGADETWDCPCHGSRFDHAGGVIQGPATEDLAPKSGH